MRENARKGVFMKKLITIIVAAIATITLTAQAEEQIERYERTVIRGTLIRLKSDLWKDMPFAPREYLVIRFDKPFEMEMEDWEYNDGKDGKVRVTEMHVIYFGEDSDLKALIGKKVIAEGETFERNTVHHMTPILFSVQESDIEEMPKKKMKSLILIILTTTVAAFADLSGPNHSPEYLETVKKADKWAIDYFKNILEDLVLLGTEPNGMSVMLAGAVVTAQENLDKVALHLAPGNPDSRA
jgi:hypothetical protein